MDSVKQDADSELMNFDNKILNQERTDRRSGQKINTEEELSAIISQQFQILNDIPNINQRVMIDMGVFIKGNKFCYNLVSKIFPYQLYFRILLENPNDKVKKLALKQLSFFSQFPSFPFNELINSPCSVFLFDLLKSTKHESVLTSIINIFTNMLKMHPELRNYFIDQGIINILSQKIISEKIPIFLEIILIIQPLLQPEIIIQINALYDCLLAKCMNHQYLESYTETYIIQNTTRSIINLLKMQFSPFDFSFVMKYINTLLDSPSFKVCRQAIRLIGFLPFPTIQFAQVCIDKMKCVLVEIDLNLKKQPDVNSDRNAIHTIIKVFIRKHEEWAGFQDNIVESCLQYTSSEDASFDNNLLCLKALFSYFPFHEYFDARMCNLLIQFVTFEDVSYQCIEKLIMTCQAEFEDDEKNVFISMIQDSIDEFQQVIEENEDDDVALLTNAFLQQIEKMKEQK